MRVSLTRLQKTALVFGLSILPHLYGISSPPLDYHYHRQGNTAIIARNYHEDGLKFFHPRIDWNGDDKETAATELPLYMWLVGVFWGVFGLGATWGRILSVFFSAMTAATIFRFLLRWMEEDAAFLGALLFSFLPVELYFGRTIQPEALSLFCYVAALWCFDDFLLNKSFASWIAGAAAAGLTVGHKLPYAHLWLILAFLAVCRKGRAAARDPWVWAFFPVSALPVIGWYWYTHSVQAAQVLPTSAGGMLNLLDYTHNPKILGYYTFYQLFSRFPEITTTYSGLVLFAAGAWAFYRRKNWFPMLWWASVVIYVIAGGGYTFQHEYTALPFAPVNAAFIGAGLWELRKHWPKPLLLALVIGIPVHAALRIAVGPKSGHWYKINFPFLLTVKPVINRLSAPDDLFFCNLRTTSGLYEIDRKGWSWDLDEVGPTQLAHFDEVTRQGAKYLLTQKTASFLTRKGPVAEHFFGRFPIVYEDADVIIFKLHPVPLPSSGQTS